MPEYRIARVEGLPDGARRSVVFLECVPQDKEINARCFFLKLGDKIRRDFLGRFQHWISGQTCDKYFHGYPNSDKRKDCFVFKKEVNSAHQRLYGFLVHPKADDQRFQTCVLLHHTQKTDETDPAVIRLLERYRLMPEIQNAINNAFSVDKKADSSSGSGTNADYKKCKHGRGALDRKKQR